MTRQSNVRSSLRLSAYGRRSPRLLGLALLLGTVTRVASAAETPTTDEGAKANSTATDRQKPAGAAGARESSTSGSLFVDPLGLALFGPTLGAELGLGQFSATLYGRWLNMGLLANSMFLNDHSEFGFSYGLGLRGRYYFRPGLVGPHVGIACEFLRTRANDPNVDKIAVKQSILVPEFEGGYRYAFGSFFVGGAAAIGYATNLGWSVENINGGNQASYYTVDATNTVYASASLEVGLFF